MISFKNTHPDFNELASREWLIANGIGGYASSTVVGANTRRYHGLLVASLNPPTARTVMVSKVEECIVFNRDCAFGLSSNQYPGAVHPQGFQYFKFFERKPLPRMKFEAHGHHLLKTVFMAHGSNTTVVEYENTGDSTFKLRLTPLFVHRDYHSLSKENSFDDYWMKPQNGCYTLYAHYGAPPLFFNFSSGEFVESRHWFKNFEYKKEQERGLDFREDCFSAFNVDVVLKPGAKAHLIFSTEEKMAKADPELLKIKELERLESLAPKDLDDSFLRDLMLAGEQFIVKRNNTEGYSLLAGYHWFTDWGRDTMIAMRGLTIASAKQEISKSILETFLRSTDRGMLPNRFPDNPNDTVEYNTIDATLWLFVALYEYHQKFQDLSFVAERFDTLTEILEHHIAGTRYGIRVTPEGFLSGGEGLAQLTWMDARVGDYVVTPRHGCPVEIQALWFNALRIYQYFAGTLGKPYEKYQAIGDTLLTNFKRYFVRPNGSLNDVVKFSDQLSESLPTADASIRPNQIYVVSLPFSLLDKDAEKRVVEVVRQHLLTDYGLRALSPEHPDFKPEYGGDPWHRDTAYHQGTVWPFLLGEYVTAFLKVNDWSEKAQKEALALLEPLKKHFYQNDCLLGISEIFDGKMPRIGKGTVHQAWSVGAILKTLLDLKARHKKGRCRSVVPFAEIKSMIF
ncbi:MAG: glycogen debranching enzyme N-terminal domain-containing protein [Saprospiraceae bacterium]|nr:glycogen debranching enzyme N-terminal domain-containing protein [Saprospiraceae bacterium]